MKNKLGIFTALILSLIIVGSAFALPSAVSANKAGAAKAKAAKTTKKTKKHHKKKATKKSVKKAPATSVTPKKTK